jgi:phosphoenolpyruvate carboxylase
MASSAVAPSGQEPDVRDEDVPLHEDVRRLGDALGKVIERLEGKTAFDVVDSLRRNCRARRRNASDAPDLSQLIDTASQLSSNVAAIVARSFFF